MPEIIYSACLLIITICVGWSFIYSKIKRVSNTEKELENKTVLCKELARLKVRGIK